MADLLTTDARMEREPMANERAVADHLRTTPTFEQLAERCRASTGPSRYIDGWIWALLMAGEPYIIGAEEGRFPQKAIYGERADIMRTTNPKDAAEYIGAPKWRYHTSHTQRGVPANGPDISTRTTQKGQTNGE